MKRSQRLRAATALAFAGWVATGHAFGQTSTEPEPTRLTFHAPVDCGSVEDFSARVQKRSARIRLIADGTSGRSLLVEIQAADAAGVLRGRVSVVELDGATRTRQLKASTCEEALDGLSLIATVTLDPEALLGEPSEPPPPAAKPEPKRPPEPTKPKPTPVTQPLPASYRLSFGIEGALLLALAPEPAFGGEASIMLELNPTRLLAPAFRLSVSHAQARGLAQARGEANFAYTLPALDVCPVRLGPAAFGIRPCGFASTGALRVWGSSADLKNESHWRFYGAAGPSLLLQVRLTKAIEIIADGRMGAAFQRDTFTLDDVVFFRTHTLGFSAGAGVAGGFP